MTSPSYTALAASGELARRAETALSRLSACTLCARRCGADRTEGVRRASCRIGRAALVHSWGAHHGEEACLSGTGGSGTIFFSGCNLRCLYCQNWEISWNGAGRAVSAEELAAVMLELQDTGCHNVNLVSPSHVAAQILEALALAASRGLCLPLVWNSGGYDALDTLELLDGVVDIYMPDAKYGDSRVARVCSGVPGYVEANRAALAEMHRQVGDLALGEDGVARRGLLVRHLALPGGLAGTAEVLGHLARSVSPATHVNVMGQYRPCFRADRHPMLRRGLTADEYAQALETARTLGLALVE